MNKDPIQSHSEEDASLIEQEEIGPSERPLRKTVFLVLKLFVSVLLIYFIFTKIQLAEIHADLHDIRWPPFFIGMALTLPNILIQYYKWRYLIRIVDESVSEKEVFASLMCGFSIGLVTPGRLGEIGRGMFIHSAFKSEMTGMAIIDKVLSQWALAVCGFTALFYILEFRFGFSLPVKLLFLFLAVIFILTLLVIVFFPKFLRKIIRHSKRLFYYAPYRRKIFGLIEASENFRRHHFMPSFYFSVAFQLVIFLQFYFFVNAFDEIDFWNGLVTAASAMFVKSLLPIAIMDLGVREGAAIFFLTKFGVPAASAFDASIMLFLSNVLLPGSVGVYYVTRFNFLKKHGH
jgi:uncharacterized membrane protein YbhN (UPF0104 family)